MPTVPITTREALAPAVSVGLYVNVYPGTCCVCEIELAVDQGVVLAQPGRPVLCQHRSCALVYREQRRQAAVTAVRQAMPFAHVLADEVARNGATDPRGKAADAVVDACSDTGWVYDEIAAEPSEAIAWALAIRDARTRALSFMAHDTFTAGPAA